METDKVNKKELTFAQVQKIIDGQIAKIEEEEKAKGVKLEVGGDILGSASLRPKDRGFKIFIKRLFNIK